MLYIKKDCTNDSIARPWKSDEKDIVFLEKWLNPGSIHSEMMNLKDCIDQSKSPVEILSDFSKVGPCKENASIFSNFWLYLQQFVFLKKVPFDSFNTLLFAQHEEPIFLLAESTFETNCIDFPRIMH